jgi:hypothetical protein
VLAVAVSSMGLGAVPAAAGPSGYFCSGWVSNGVVDFEVCMITNWPSANKATYVLYLENTSPSAVSFSYSLSKRQNGSLVTCTTSSMTLSGYGEDGVECQGNLNFGWTYRAEGTTSRAGITKIARGSTVTW